MQVTHISAHYFDGQSSLAHRCSVIFGRNGALTVTFEGGASLLIGPGEYRYHQPVGRSAIRFDLPNSAALECPYDKDLARAVEVGIQPARRFVVRAERHLPLALVVIVGALLAIMVAYRYGPVALSAVVRPVIPEGVKEVIGSQILTALDYALFEPTEIGQEDDLRVQSLVRELGREGGHDLSLRLHLRKLALNDSAVGNAFAILPNTVVVTDELVRVLTPTEIEGVLAHELGHLVHDHGTTRIIRSSAVSILTLLIFGADPGIAHAVALGLLEAQYTRAQEEEADLFAKSLLRRLGKDPAALATALEKLTDDDGDAGALRYLSSHPATADRVQFLRAP